MSQIIENVDAYVETIVENWNIGIKISEGNDYMLPVLLLRRRLLPSPRVVFWVVFCRC